MAPCCCSSSKPAKGDEGLKSHAATANVSIVLMLEDDTVTLVEETRVGSDGVVVEGTINDDDSSDDQSDDDSESEDSQSGDSDDDNSDDTSSG